jgi:hypothetical protein
MGIMLDSYLMQLLLRDGVTYYATQTENSCESPNRQSCNHYPNQYFPANDYAELFCDDLNDGSEK